MKKSSWVLVIFLFASMLLNSCSPTEEIKENAESKSFWKLTSSEIWGIKPITGAKYEQFSSFPFNQTYSFSSRANITYSGQEMNITKTELDPVSNLSSSVTNTWTQLPAIIHPNTAFKVTYESKGSAINGISISVPVYYTGSYDWYTFSSNNGPVSSNLLMSQPDKDPSHQKMKIAIRLASGYAYYYEWVYVYQWTQ